LHYTRLKSLPGTKIHSHQAHTQVTKNMNSLWIHLLVIFADFPLSLMFGSILKKGGDGTYMGQNCNNIIFIVTYKWAQLGGSLFYTRLKCLPGTKIHSYWTHTQVTNNLNLLWIHLLVIFADFPFSLMFGSIFEKRGDGTYMGHIHNTSLPCNLQKGPIS
jgi:hypothetical protein